MNSMRFTVLSCMNNIERLWIGTSDGEVFEIGYHSLMKLAEEKLLDKAKSIKCQVKAGSGIISRFYPPCRGIITQIVQHPFDGRFIVGGFNHRHKSWYVWLPS